MNNVDVDTFNEHEQNVNGKNLSKNYLNSDKNKNLNV